SLLDNPTISQVDISAVAGGQDSVTFRFRYQYGSTTNTAGGSNNWMIDDVVLSDADQDDLKTSGSGILMATGTGDTTSFSNIPLSLIGDTLIPITRITNLGADNQTNVQVDVDVLNGSSSVFTDSKVISSLPVNTYDSRVTFSQFKLTNTGSYSAISTANLTGDVNTADNSDTLIFAVSDSLYTRYAFNNGR